MPSKLRYDLGATKKQIDAKKCYADVGWMMKKAERRNAIIQKYANSNL